MTTSEHIKLSHHHVLAAYEAWGHTRPLCTLAARIAESRPVMLTIVTTRPFYDRVVNEISRSFTAREAEVRARVRVVAVATREDVQFDVEMFNVSFQDLYQKLVNEEAITCAKTGAQLPAVASPDTAIFDVFSYHMFLLVRKWSIKDVKVYCWVPTSAAATYYLFGPGGGYSADTRRLIEQEVERSGRSMIEIAEEVFCNVSGRVIEVPGVPAMYDHEHYPQKTIAPDLTVGMYHLAAHDFLDACDGVLISTSVYFEPPEAIAAVRLWLSDTSRKTYIMGPMLPPDSHASDEAKQPTKTEDTQLFMERILRSHGPNSMLYISFGSFFWCTEPERIWTFIDVLLDKRVPFMMSHASPFAKVPEWILEKAQATGLAMLSPWSPQQTVLNHEVTGWFVTHCGWNSLVESMSAGVPMICWPYQADQPLNSLHLTDNLNIAYELTEVRTGHGLKPVYRTGKSPVATLEAIREETRRVLSLAFGADGAEKRSNALRLQVKISTLWDEEGSSRADLRRFLDDIQ